MALHRTGTAAHARNADAASPAARSPRSSSGRMFCLFAAETLRRNWRGGPRSWLLVTDALGVPLTQADCRSLTAAGLRYWRRESEDRRHQLLSICIALFSKVASPTPCLPETWRHSAGFCGGAGRYRGLPCRRSRCCAASDRRTSREITGDLAGRRNPRTGGRATAGHCARAAADAPSSAGSSAGLVGNQPEWQAGLPLDIASDRVRKLLVSLIVQPRKQTTRTLSRLCYRILVRQGDGWRCSRGTGERWSLSSIGIGVPGLFG